MSLHVSPEIEARIVTRAREAGVSVEDYLEQLVSESEEFAAAVHRLEEDAERLSQAEIQAKLDRGLAQFDRGEHVDGEQFMEELLSGIDDVERQRRRG